MSLPHWLELTGRLDRAAGILVERGETWKALRVRYRWFLWARDQPLDQ